MAKGQSDAAVAHRLATRPATVSKWRGCFARQGLADLADAPRSGKPRRYAADAEQRILAALDAPPPAGYARWNSALLAKHLGDISKHQIWRVLRAHGISLERRRSGCISTDPAFAQKATDIVALYLQPPENAVVLAVDEEPTPSLLERAQGWPRLPNGKALTGFIHAFKRHGTTTLFAALDVATADQSRSLPAPSAGRVPALHEPSRRRLSRPRAARHSG